MQTRRGSARALVVALAASAAVIIGSPYIGQARAAVQDAFPGHYRAVIGGAIVAAIAMAITAAIARIRERRRLRYGLLAAALVTGAAYATVSRTGIIEQDLVEQFHFVEYGLLTFLYYRGWRHRRDLAALVLPGCAAFTTGVADEWLQWFVPSRVGEFHDLMINGAAAVCGTLFSVGVDPPPAVTWPPDRPARTAVAAALSGGCLAAAVFVHAVHLGYLIVDSGSGRFRSTFPAETLEAAAADRAARWRRQPPEAVSGLAREDHYFSEAEWHLQRRNEAREDGMLWVAWNENRILERFYWPVLELGHRWPADDVVIAAFAAGTWSTYLSDAEPYSILTLPVSLWWLGVSAVVIGLWAVATRATVTTASTTQV
jgi:VanZ family protein